MTMQIKKLHLLILEDDELFAQSLEDFLDEEGFEVTLAHNGEEAIDLCYEREFDLLLLDVNVPKMNGFEVLANLRNLNKNTPAIFITSFKDKSSIQKGFISGGDDYMVKPIDLDELSLRIKALLKRACKLDNIIYINDLAYNPSTGKLSNEHLNNKCKKLLDLLLEHKNQCVNKDQIFSQVWDWNETPSDASLRVYITTLKKILGKDSIINHKGRGYSLEL